MLIVAAPLFTAVPEAGLGGAGATASTEFPTLAQTVKGLPQASRVVPDLNMIGKTGSAIKILDQGGGAFQLAIAGKNGIIEVISDISTKGNQLILSKLHIDGLGPGSSSISELRNIARELGKQTGATEVVIQGGTRTTGANPGKIPRDIIIKVP